MTLTKPGTDTPPYYYPTLTYDPVRGVIVIMAGYYQARQLWELNTSDWTMVNRSTPVNGPLQRQYPALAFDTKNGKLILFGGLESSMYRQDTWEWSGTSASFLQRTTVDTKPEGRYQGAMAYDSKRSRIMLYGGTGQITYDDLWQWDPATRVWSQITVTGTRPGAMYGHWLFYDEKRDKLLLFNNSGYAVWEYDPALNNWKNRTQSPQPSVLSGRSYVEVAFDTARGKLVMVGGHNGTVYSADVVEWDTTLGTWELRTPASTVNLPVGRYYHAVTYDSTRKVLLLFGGHASVTGLNEDLDDSWEWDGLLGTWTETSSTGVRPLPRENHILTFDTVRGTTYLFGGSVPADTAYGPQEIWEYIPNSAPRANGAGCSVAAAGSCMSGNCVDGVCCAVPAAQCAGTCRACNVSGKEGTCSDVPVGLPDDTCPSDQSCDANHACKTRLGQNCTSYADCASGNCSDGVCCDSACTTACKACNLSGKRGTCSNIAVGEEDPVDNACVSVDEQPRLCDGNGTCMNGKKANGKACTAGGQCTTGYCIDGVCCNSTCNMSCYQCNRADALGTCAVIAIGLVDHSATTPCDGSMQYCNGSGTCATNKKPNGEGCGGNTDCGSGYCVDGVCCNGACTGACQACNVPGRLGACGNVLPGATDASCGSGQYCDAAAICQTGAKPNGATCAVGTDCGSGFCVDGLCCTSACKETCYACNVPGVEGVCSPTPNGGVDLMATTTCTPPNYCNKDHACTTGKKPNGAVCGGDGECGSNLCVDGTCCESSCLGRCRSCKNATGTCAMAAQGQDPRGECKGEVGDLKSCGGTCDGAGSCAYAASGLDCSTAGCQSDGYIRAAGKCDGAGKCNAAQTTDCNGFRCVKDPVSGQAKCKTSCLDDPECANKFYCQSTADGGTLPDGGADAGGPDGGTASQCPPVFDDGHACTRNTQCFSGTCSDGVCCNVNCDKCGTCNMPGSVGNCIPIAAGTDPEMECTDSASDPTGLCKGFCNGHAGCTYVAAGTTCGTCKACNGVGLCNVKPDDDTACGAIDCDTLDTSCNDYHDLTSHRCGALGSCKAPNLSATCTDLTSTCGIGGAGGGTGGKGGGAGGGGRGGSQGAAGSGPKDGGSNDDGGMAKSGGGGCGCDLGGSTPAGFASLLLGLGAVLARRRRR